MNTEVVKKRLERRIVRTRKKIFGDPEKPRLAVHKSLRQIEAQIIDDTKGITLVSLSSLSPELKSILAGKKKTEIANLIGEKLAEIAKAKGIERVVFDRHGAKYHGRIKAFAEGARKGGLIF